MHRTHHLIDPSFDIRSPACAAPTHTVDHSAIQALLAKQTITKPATPRRFTVDEPVEHFYEAVLGNCSPHVRLLFRVGGTD